MDALIRLLPAVIIPSVSLFYINILIPHLLGPQQFSVWRITSAFLAFSGAAHLGLADGIYRRWLHGPRPEARLSAVLFRAYLGLITCSSVIFTLVFWQINRYALVWTVIFFIGSVAIALYSLTLYALSINENGRRLAVCLSAQPLLFLGLVTIVSLSRGSGLGALGVLGAYVLSFMVINLVYVRKIITSAQHAETRVGTLLREGCSLLVANLSLIFYLNADKLNIARLAAPSTLGSYLLFSSFFVASAGLGSAMGNLLLSKQKDFFMVGRRRRLMTASFLLVAGLAGLLMNRLGLRFGVYDLAWLPTLLACGSIFAFSGIYAPLFRIYFPRFSIVTLFALGMAILGSQVVVLRAGLSVDRFMGVIVGFNLLLLALHELTLSLKAAGSHINFAVSRHAGK